MALGFPLEENLITYVVFDWELELKRELGRVNYVLVMSIVCK